MNRGLVILDKILDMVEAINRELEWLGKLPSLSVEQANRLAELKIKYLTIKEIMEESE